MTFKKGHPGGPGRPKGTGRATILANAYRGAITVDDITALALRVQKQLMNDDKIDSAMLKFHLDRLCGPPKQYEYLEELERIKEHIGIKDDG